VGPPSALLVIAIQHAASGLYFSSVVLPNHQGMPQVGGGGERDFLRRQVVATRNVSSNWLTDLWFGSLNLQIEHHLFPRMTRANLRRARPIVRAYCRELGVAYHEVSVPRAYLELLRFLHEVGAPLRRPGAVELLDRRTLG
jgi:fatty acid desaturase